MQFSPPNPGVTASDSVRYFYPGKAGGFSYLWNAGLIRTKTILNQNGSGQPANFWTIGTGEIDATNLGTAITPIFSLVNPTAATSILNQNSGFSHWQAQGWGGSSQSVDFYAGVVPITGSTSPVGTWDLYSQINGGPLFRVLQASSSGTLNFSAFTSVFGELSGNNYASSGIAHALFSNGTLYQTADNDVLANVDLNSSFVANSGLATVIIDNAGSTYTNGTYTNVPVINASGTHGGPNLCLATVIISSGSIASLTPTTFGAAYAISDNITINASDVGGTGTGFLSHVNALHTYTGGKFLDLRVANGVQFNAGIQAPGLSSITATAGLGIDGSGNIGAITLPTTITGGSGIIDSLGTIKLSDGSAGFITSPTLIGDADNTAALTISPGSSGSGIELQVNQSTNHGYLILGTVTSILKNIYTGAKTVGIAPTTGGLVASDQSASVGILGAASYKTNSRKNLLAYAQIGAVKDLADSVKATISAGATGANPTASAGTTAVNGSSANFMRSDAAPKIDSTQFATSALVSTYLSKAAIVAAYQPLLVSGTNIKTVNSTTLLGSGNLAITTANTDTTATGFVPKAALIPYLTKAQILALGYGTGTVTSVTGTTNRITSTGGTTPAIDISSTFEALLGKVANPLSQFASTTSAQLAGVLSDETGTGVAVFGTTPTIATPVINGLPTGTGIASAATASTLVSRDANSNIFGNAFVQNFTTSAKTGGTVTLTSASTPLQYRTGASAETDVLPVVSTLKTGWQYTFVNTGSLGNISVQSSGANAVTTVGPGGLITVTCKLNTGTSAASWQVTGGLTQTLGTNAIITTNGFNFTVQNATSSLDFNDSGNDFSASMGDALGNTATLDVNGPTNTITLGATTINTYITANSIVGTDGSSYLIALPKPIHSNSTTTGTATTAVTVTIGSTLANTTYNVSITPRDLLTAVNYYISAQTTTTFTVTFVTALTGSINFDWNINQ